MRRAFAAALILAFACGLLTAPLLLAAAEPAKAAADRVPGVRGDVLMQLHDAEKKLVALAEATPAEKFTWRPAEGVRSIGEVYLHVAGGNYEISSAWGAKPPAGVDVENLEKNGADKAKAIAELKASFDSVDKSIAAMSEKDLDREISMFGRKGTVRMAVIITAVHAHEHLGQAIAYARMNGIVPPWSAPQPK